jgi:pimeloyl-ACP methyl ester carboxylesterase
MTSLTDAVRRFRAGRDAVPPFFAGATEGPLAVGREIFENPRTLTLPDGRDLGYAVAGDPAGDPGLVFHGWPNCRTFAAAFDEIGSERGLRIVAPERPGFGVSDPDPGRQLTDWPADVTALMDHLGIDEAPVLGISGGGPYALSCAHEVPGRTPRAAVGCGVGPMRAVSPAERGPFTVARYAPRVIQSYLRAEEVAARYAPERLLERRAATRSASCSSRRPAPPARVTATNISSVTSTSTRPNGGSTSATSISPSASGTVGGTGWSPSRPGAISNATSPRRRRISTRSTATSPSSRRTNPPWSTGSGGHTARSQQAPPAPGCDWLTI